MADTGAPGFLPLFDDNSPFTPIQTPFNAISTALNTALANDIKNKIKRVDTLANLNLPANAGTDVNQKATVYADTTPSNNGDYRWTGTAWLQISFASAQASLFPAFATAAGSGTNAGGAYGTVNFPAGRFTQPPLVFGKTKGAQPAIFHTSTITTSTALCAGFVGTGAVAASWDWFAIQMLPGAAAG